MVPLLDLVRLPLNQLSGIDTCYSRLQQVGPYYSLSGPTCLDRLDETKVRALQYQVLSFNARKKSIERVSFSFYAEFNFFIGWTLFGLQGWNIVGAFGCER